MVHFIYADRLGEELFFKSLREMYGSKSFKWTGESRLEQVGHLTELPLIFIVAERSVSASTQRVAQIKRENPESFIINLRQNIQVQHPTDFQLLETLYFPDELDDSIKLQLLRLSIDKALAHLKYQKRKGKSLAQDANNGSSTAETNQSKRYQYAIESLHAAVWDLTEAKGKREFQWSKHIYRLLGYKWKEKESSLNFIKRIIHGNDSKKLIEAFGVTLQIDMFPLELRLKTKSNGIRWFKMTAKEVDDRLNLKQYVGTLEDIQDFKSAQQKLRQNEKRFKNLVDQSPVPTFIIQGESVVYANSRTLDLVKPVDKGRAVVENVLELLPAPSIYRISVAGRSVLSGHIESSKFDIELNLPERQPISCQVSLTRIDYNNGYALLGTAVNLTEHVRSQLILAEKEEALRNAQKLAKVGSWQWTQDSGKLVWSDYMYEIFELPLNQTPTLDAFMKRVVQDDKQLVMLSLEKAEKHAQLSSISYRIATRNGGIKHLKAEAQRIDGNTIIGTVQDITETANLELKLLDQKQIMNTVLTGLPIDVALYDSCGEYVYANYHHELDGKKTLMGKTDMYLFNEGQISLETAVNRSQKLEEVVKNKKNIEWSETNDNGGHMACKLIPYSNHNSVEQILFYRIDLSKEKASETRLRRRVDFEKLIIDLFNQLMNTRLVNIDSYIENSLMKIGDFIQADRSYIYQFERTSNSYQEWIKDDFVSKKNAPKKQIIGTRALTNWARNLNPTEVVLLGGSKSQPNHPLLQSGITDSRMNSTLIVPLEWQRKIIGFLGFEILDNSKSWALGTQTFLGLSGQVFTNAIERKISQSALTASEVKFRTLTENAHAGIFITSEYRMVYANPTASRITGYEYDELLSMSLLELFHRDEQRDAKRNGRLLDQGKKTFSRSQRKIVSKNGEIRFIDIASNLIDYNGKKSLISIAIDITENKKVEEEKSQLIQQLTRQNTDLEQFSYITSHNLRSPVAGIQGLVNILDWKALGGEFNTEILKRIKAATNRLDDTIKELNEIISVRKKSSELKQVINLENLIQETCLKHQDLFDKSQAKLDLKVEGFENMYATKGYMESIFSNLIVNAIKYKQVNQQPLIEVTSRIASTNAIIEISDNGTGIDLSKFKDKVFKFKQRFHRNIEGSGIGLYLVKTQVEALGGSVSIESEVNKGTTFTLTFPKSHAVQWVKN